MPFVYSAMSAFVADNFVTSATNNQEINAFFLKPGARNIGIQAMYVGGKGQGLTSLSGIAYRIKKYPTTAASGGTAITPAPRDIGMQACKASSGAASAGVANGTGTLVFMGGCTSGAAGPGGWTAPNPDSLMVLEGSANQSLDLFSASATPSLNYEFTIEFQE